MMCGDAASDAESSVEEGEVFCVGGAACVGVGRAGTGGAEAAAGVRNARAESKTPYWGG